MRCFFVETKEFSQQILIKNNGYYRNEGTISLPSFLLKVLFSNIVAFRREKKKIRLISIDIGLYFEKRAANLYTNEQNSYFYVKIGLWILTTNFTSTALLKVYKIILVINI